MLGEKAYTELGVLSKDGLIAAANDLLYGVGLSPEDAIAAFSYAVSIIKKEEHD